MSADSYADCPKCKSKYEEDSSRLKKELLDSYGKIPIEEFKAKEAELRDLQFMAMTVGEYYDIGIWSGKFCVNYGCQCSTCGFEFNYKIDDIELKVD